MTYQDIINGAVQELNTYAPGDPIATDDQTSLLYLLNELLDYWNVKREAVWSEIFTAFTLVPALSPHTIGPSASTPTFTMAVRPVTLDGCDLILDTTTPNVFTPIEVINWPAYKAIPTPGISTAIPLQVYYQKDWPLGKLFFYPIPDFNYGVRLATRTLIDQVTATTPLDLPPGYRRALRLTFAEYIATTFGRQIPDATATQARAARADIFDANTIPLSLNLHDGQGSGPNVSTFNWLSRSF